MAKITDYPSITTINANTILLADGSSGTGKILASDMAKYALETYAGSTLAGSAQSVKSAFSSIFANGSNIDASNVDSLKTSAIYCRYIEAAAITGFPIMSNGFGLFIVSNGTSTAERVGQYIFMPNSGTMAMRYDNGGTWGPWKMDASTIIKITTSITDYVDALPDNSLIKLWSSSSDGAKVGSPFGTSCSVYYEIDKINASTAYVKAKAMVRSVADQDVVYVKQKWGSGWADDWTKVPARAEVDALSSNVVLSSGAPETVTASTDIDDYIIPGTYFFNSSTKAAHAPANSGYFRLLVTAPTGDLGGTNRVRYQEAITSVGVAYTRVLRSSNAGSTWTAESWETQNKMTINGIYRLSDAASLKPLSLNVPNGSRHLLILTGPYVSQAHAVYTVSCNTSGNVYAFRIGGTDDLPDKTSGTENSLTLTSTAESNRLPAVVDVVLSGSQITIAS